MWMWRRMWYLRRRWLLYLDYNISSIILLLWKQRIWRLLLILKIHMLGNVQFPNNILYNKQKSYRTISVTFLLYTLGMSLSIFASLFGHWAGTRPAPTKGSPPYKIPSLFLIPVFFITSILIHSFHSWCSWCTTITFVFLLVGY